MKSYGVAVASSIGVALGIRKALSGYTKHMKGSKLILMNSISSFFACSTAGFLNAYVMRKTELNKGIDALDENGKSYGKSKACAKKAVTQTAISRYVLAIPIFLPPVLLLLTEKVGMMPRNFYLKTFVEVSYIALELYLAVPMAIAMYPQVGKINANELEEEFRNIKDERGVAVKEFYFNKGL